MKKSYWIILVVVAVVVAAVYLKLSGDKVLDEKIIADKANSEPTTEETNQINEQTNQQSMDTSNQSSAETSELKIETLKEGTGAAAKAGDTISVHYTGTFLDGKKFDSSLDRGTPFEFTLGGGQVIQGWDQGLVGMKVGEQRKLTIPYQLGYGENGYGSIPAKATLIFEVELLAIK